MLRLIALLLLASIIPHVYTFSPGSPICDIATPQASVHAGFNPPLAAASTQAGQKIQLTDAAGNPVTTYTPGTPITVTVTGVTRGLVIYAKIANGVDHVGQFTIPPAFQATMKSLTCPTPAPGATPAGSTVGHSSNTAKTNTQLTWVLPTPTTITAPLVFQGMFTNPQGNFQVYQLADVTITKAAAAPTTASTTAPTTAPTLTPTTVPTTPPATLPPGTTIAPATVPNPPTSVAAEAGNAVVTIMLTPPLFNGGSPITRYNATCISPVPCTVKPFSVVAANPQAPLLAAVTNGVAYTFQVVAINALGASKPVQTLAVTPTATASVPGPPTNILVMPQDGAALVSWSLPTTSGGSVITGYIVSAYPGTNGAQPVARVTTIGMSATLTGLTPGMSYQFSVVAVNKNGMSTAAQTANNVLIPVVGTIAPPNMITGLFAVAYDRTVRLTWDKPTTTNIISYVIRNNLGQVMNVTGQPVTFDQLMNFVPYTFQIAAVNVAGVGPFSSFSSLVVPAALPVTGAPGVPSNVMATTTNGAVTVTWTAGTVGASLTTTYWVIASTGQNMSVSAVQTAAAGDAPTMATFPAGTLMGSVSFVVVAANTQGTSQPSTLSPAVTVSNAIQQMPPQNPTITKVEVGIDGTTVTVTFDPPVDTGNSPIISYTAYDSNMKSTVTGPSSPLVLTNVNIVSGLMVYVLATNAIGSSMPDPAAGTLIPMKANNAGGFTDGPFTTSWKINTVDQTITITMTGKCTGYVSIGFAPGGKMASGADYYTGFVDDNTGVLTLADTFSTSYAAPPMDAQQDIISATGTQVNGVTTITFTRLLVTTDTAQDYPITMTNQPMYIHWAVASADDLVSYHTARGVQTANVFTGQATAVVIDRQWNAAYLLCIIALAVFMLYATVRWVHKLVKACRHRRHIHTLERTSSTSQVVPIDHNKSVSSLNNSSQVAMVRAQAKSLSEYHAQLSGTHDEHSEDRSLQSNPALVYGAGSSLSSQQVGEQQGHRRMITSVGPSPITANSQQQKNWEAQWQALQTEEGWNYYYNEKTQETAWEIPPMPDYFEGRGARYSIASPQRDALSMDQITVESNTQQQRSAIPPSAAAARYALAKKSNRLMAQLFAIFHYRIPKTQFSLNQILVFIAYVVINIICLMVVDKQTEMATRWGWLACGNFVLVALPATRNSVLIWVLGYSFDVVMVFHRWIGRFVFVASTAHMFGWYYLWSQQGLSIYDMQFRNPTNPSYARGFYAWLALLIVQILSLDFFRRRHFEFFYHTHFTFVVCYVMAYLHEPQQGPYYTAILIIYLLDRAVRMFWGIVPLKTTLLQAKGGDILQVRFPKHPLARAANLYKVGQYVFVNFPQLSITQWHPFSISSAPNERTAEIHIRSLGDYTRTMLQKVKANKQQDLWIRVDGPYGSHRMTYHRYPVLILVGGGIGITPIISILKDIYHVGDFDPKSQPKVNAIEGICCVWVIPNQATYEWFADEFEKLVAASQNPMMPPLFLWVYVTRDSNLGPSSNFVAGKPDFDHIFSCAAKDYRGKATCVFACGPEMMVGQAWDATNTRKRAGDTFSFHHETFEW